VKVVRMDQDQVTLAVEGVTGLIPTGKVGVAAGAGARGINGNVGNGRQAARADDIDLELDHIRHLDIPFTVARVAGDGYLETTKVRTRFTDVLSGERERKGHTQGGA
jgi:glucose/arabinose dehydrogenase